MTTDLEQVQQAQERLAALEQQAAELGEREATLSQKIAAAHASGSGDLEKLSKQRREVRGQRADLLEAIPLLRETITRDRESAARAAAEKRLTGIARAFGSVKQELDEDEARVTVAAEAYHAAVERLNQRFKALNMLRAEAGALRDRFGVSAPALPPVVLPARREGCTAAAMAVQRATFLDTGLRLAGDGAKCVRCSASDVRGNHGLARLRDHRAGGVEAVPAAAAGTASGPRAPGSGGAGVRRAGGGGDARHFAAPESVTAGAAMPPGVYSGGLPGSNHTSRFWFRLHTKYSSQ